MKSGSKKYPHGYLPKISYWMGKWEAAAKVRDEESMKAAEKKLMYFFVQQLKLNDDGTNWDRYYL